MGSITKGRGWHGESARHRLARLGVCTVKKPVMDPTGHPWAKLDTDSEYARKWRVLEERLLSFGGKRLVKAGHEPDLASILAWGELIDGSNAAFIKGEKNKCHSNAGFLFEQFPEDTRVMTGYALSKDGLWRQHSWTVDTDDNSITETTEMREKYYGFRMTKQESQKFADENEVQEGFPEPWEEGYYD